MSEQTYAVGRMEELIEHFKPVSIRQIRETYFFWDVNGKRTTIAYHEKDEEGRNLYMEKV